MTDRKVSFNEIMNSSNRLKDKVVKTPLLQSSYLNQKFKTNLFLKAENLQTIGAFKYRGALNAVLQLPDNIKKVVAWSSGNHAQAVAAAAKITGREATIVMPIDSPKAKLEGTAFWGASIIKYDRKKEDREQIGREIANKTNGKLYFKEEFKKLKYQLLENKSFYITQKSIFKEQNLIDWKWILCCIIFLLSLEWFMRKYQGKL